MRDELHKWRKYHPLITYRGKEANRVDNLTDAVFGIAITLLIFNLNNPDTFEDLLVFAKTLPAFLISISFLILIWNEHFRFSEVYGVTDTWLVVINTGFIALIIFYVYPLRFLTLILSKMFFGVSVGVKISGGQIPDLMIYYGLIAFALYFCLWIFYKRAARLDAVMGYNSFEKFFTKAQQKRMVIMFSVPLVSVLFCFMLKPINVALASTAAGMAYWLYMPLMMFWQRNYRKKEKEFLAKT